MQEVFDLKYVSFSVKIKKFCLVVPCFISKKCVYFTFSLQTIIPGHNGRFGHFLVSLFSPEQVRPPNWGDGLVQVRVEV